MKLPIIKHVTHFIEENDEAAEGAVEGAEGSEAPAADTPATDAPAAE